MFGLYLVAGRLGSLFPSFIMVVPGYYVIQHDQLYMAVLLMYLVKRDLYTTVYKVAYTSVTFYKVPKQHDHVYLIKLYLDNAVMYAVVKK